MAERVQTLEGAINQLQKRHGEIGKLMRRKALSSSQFAVRAKEQEALDIALPLLRAVNEKLRRRA